MAIKDMPPNHRETYSEAIELSARGEYGAAAEIMADLTMSYPKSTGLNGLTGLFYYKAKLFDTAILYLRRALSLNPRSKLAARGLYHSLWEKGDLQGARDELQQFVELTECEEFKELLGSLEQFMKSDDGIRH